MVIISIIEQMAYLTISKSTQTDYINFLCYIRPIKSGIFLLIADKKYKMLSDMILSSE